MEATSPHGLTAAEVAERRGRGLVNRSPQSHVADYVQIVWRNVLTVFNLMVVPAAIALWWLHETYAALAVSGMAVVNSLMGLVQEIRAKWHLDRLAILVETRVRVWRDGQLQTIPASQVVEDDQIQMSAGDAIVADGTVLEARFLEVDEALLTGESDPVRRQAGDQLLSGSFCVAGEGIYRADRVGNAAFAQSTSAEARRYSLHASPLTRTINQIIEILTGVAVTLIAIYFLLYCLAIVTDRNDLVKMIAATITSMVPQGLVLTATVSFTLGAVVMSMRGAVVQQLNAVEAMASIDIICTDKTGTLTTNRLQLEQVIPLAPGVDEVEARRRLRLFASAAIDQQNKTVQSLQAALGKTTVEVLDQLPFKSQNRYSAVRLRDGGLIRLLVLGAPEGMGERAALGSWPDRMRDLQRTGRRVLLAGEVPTEQAANTRLADVTALPAEVSLEPLALLALTDELRPEARQTILNLAQQGIAFKVVSGDNPDTVRATVAAITPELGKEQVISGDQLARASDPGQLIDTHSVFGRVAPRQKVDIVQALQKRGRRVAMIGDGVNDVLSIKRSDLGIAMGEGSQASKTVASLVLENNNFALLPETLEEGRTIIRNLRRSGKLFLVKNVYSLIFILAYASGIFGIAFPYEPQQVTLLNWLVIGIPAFIIALTRERSRAPVKTRYLLEVGWFAIRTGVLFGVAGVLTLVLTRYVWGDPSLDSDQSRDLQRTMLLSVLILLSVTTLFRVLTDGEPQPLQGDSRIRWLGVVAIIGYLLAMYLPPSAIFFKLVPLSPTQWWQVLVIVVPTWYLTTLTDQMRLGDWVTPALPRTEQRGTTAPLG